MKFIEHAGQTLALLLAWPNWEKPFKVEMSVPWAEVTDARSGAETRQPFGETARYSLEYSIDTSDARETTDLRMWLMRLRDETVAVPMWADYVEVANAFNAGATVLPLVYGPPVNYGAEWIILAPDNSNFEIVVVSAVSASSITISPATLNWPAGTRIFPLLFGRILPNERPRFKGDTDEVANATITVREDSPWARRINPFNPGTGQATGAGVPAFAATPLLNIRPHHAEPIDTVDIDLLLTELGFGRERAAYAGPYAAVRGNELDFLFASRAEIAALAWLYVNRQGPTLRFMAPSFRGDLRLADDVASGDSVIDIEASRYTDEDFSTNPGAPFLALVDPQRITAVQVATIGVDGLHLVAPVGQAYGKKATKLSNLILSRFAETTLTLNYASDGNVTTKARTVEVPNEYSDPPVEKTPRAYLLKFIEHVDVDVVLGYFTSYERPITGWAQTWQPAPFALGGESEKLDLTDKLAFSTFDFAAIDGVTAENPLRKILEGTLEGWLECEVIQARPVDPETAAAVIISGEVVDFDGTGKEWKAAIDPFSRFLEQNTPGFFKQKVCNVQLFSPKCAAGRPGMREEFKSVGTIAVIDGTTIDLDPVAGQPNPTAKEIDYFALGLVEAGTGVTYEGRTINHSEVVGSRLRLVLSRALRKTAVGAQLRFWPTCNGSTDMCHNRFGNLVNNRGHEHTPKDNPSADIPAVQQDVGGKKG